MPDFLSFLRQKNIFGVPPFGNDLPSQGGITGNMPFNQPQSPFENIDFGAEQFNPTGIAPTSFAPDEYDVSQRMRELYQPTYDASQQLESMISQYPQQEKPSWLRRIGAMLSDYKYGPQVGRDVLERPYREKVEEWKNKIVPTQQAAGIERQENVNARTLAFQQISSELRQKAQEAKEKNDEKNTLIRQQRADIYDFKARNPTMKIIMPKGGNVMAINPMTGETHDLGISTGSLTETDKINLQQEDRLEQIKTTGEQARETEKTRQTGREAVAETRGWKIYNVPDPDRPGQQKAVRINEITGETRDVTSGPAKTPISGVMRVGTGGGAKGELPTQTRIRQFNAARELANTRPELRKFIKLGSPGSNDFTITPPGTNYFGTSTGPTQEQYNEIQRIIYGSPSGPTISTNAPPAPKGWKYIPKQGGGWTAVPDTGK